MTGDWRDRLRPTFEQSYPGMLDGESANFGMALQSIRLKSGAQIRVEPGAVTAIVGANNAGKSTLLRELVSVLQMQPGNPPLELLSVDSVDVSHKGTIGDFTAWLAERSTTVVRPNEVGFQRMGSSVVDQHFIQQVWVNDFQQFGPYIWPFVAFYANADARLSMGGSVEMRDKVSDPPSHPVHYLQDDRALLEQISSITETIFGQPLTLDALARTLRLRVGRLDEAAPPVDNIPPSYRAAMSSLHPLDEQGDGMRSLLGQLLPLLTGAYPLVLIDEPEAFLHPPQAHALGVQLGQLASEFGTQVLVATHDRNLLAGLLSSGVDTSVVRLSRSGSGSPAAYQLDASELRKLWTDPVLKYTNVLDGLFHRMVVLAEAEGDCGYLAAALDCPAREPSAIPANEVLFIPTGGKEGMAKVANALRAVQVPVVAAPDLDRLSDRPLLRRLVESVGSTWSEAMDAKWNHATADLRARREPALVGHVLDAITKTLESSRDEPYSNEYKEAVKAQLRSNGSGWDAIKDYGMAGFRGEARARAEELIALLDAARVVLVREGELERLAPEVTVRKGPGWLLEALTVGAQCNAATQAHVNRILAAGALPVEPKVKGI